MKLITRFELASTPTKDLWALRRELFNALARSAVGTVERCHVIASLENVDAELSTRPPTP